MQILAKISSHNVKVDFSLILFDLHACYSELRFKTNLEIPIQKKIWNSHFRLFQLVLDVYIVLNTIRKMSFSIILKSQPI